MDFDFLLLNVSGFVFYLTFTTYGYFAPDGIKCTGRVELSDVVFSYHALFVTSLAVVQACIYPKGSNHVSSGVLFYLVSLCIFLSVYALTTEVTSQ